jgi:hypothetical protein
MCLAMYRARCQIMCNQPHRVCQLEQLFAVSDMDVKADIGLRTSVYNAGQSIRVMETEGEKKISSPLGPTLRCRLYTFVSLLLDLDWNDLRAEVGV